MRSPAVCDVTPVDVDALAALRVLIAECDTRLDTLTRERGRLVEAYMELELKRRFGARLHAVIPRTPHARPRRPLVAGFRF